MANIHFLPDSPYSNWFVKNCNNCQSNTINEFYFVGADSIYIDKTLIKAIDSEQLETIIIKLNESTKYKKVYLHYLDIEKAQIVNAIRNYSIKIIWIIWSEDLYGLPKLNVKKFNSYSSKFIKKLEKSSKPKITFKQYIGRLKMIYWDGIDLNGNWQLIYKAIGRINYCVTGIEEEALIIKSKLNTKIKSLPFAYISVTNDLIIDKNIHVKKEYIQVGNSADPANNHYEVLYKLHKLGIKDQMILPLSYGNVEYTNQLLKDVSDFFNPNQLVVLKDFMAKEIYYEQLKKVRSAIFAHNIQQAFGNIIALISFGAKVFLKKENLLFKQFNKWGISVFSIEDDMTLINISTDLDEKTVKKNQELIFKLFSEEKVIEHYKNLLSI